MSAILQFSKNLITQKYLQLNQLVTHLVSYKKFKVKPDLSKNIHSFNLFIGSKINKTRQSIQLELESKEKHPKHFGEKKIQNAKIQTLDEFIHENSITNVDFIKLDVDGFEFYVLKGGYNFLRKKTTYIHGACTLSL